MARKLLPTERREKKLKKLFDDSGLDSITTVYKVRALYRLRDLLGNNVLPPCVPLSLFTPFKGGARVRSIVGVVCGCGVKLLNKVSNLSFMRYG